MCAVYGSRLAGRTTLGSTPVVLPSPSVPSDVSLLSDSIGDESFSGFSEKGSDTSSERSVSGYGGVTGQGFAASATLGHGVDAIQHGKCTCVGRIVKMLSHIYKHLLIPKLV